MTTIINSEKSMAAAKIAVSKFNEIVMPWVKRRYEEAQPVIVKYYNKSKAHLEDLFISLSQKAS